MKLARWVGAVAAMTLVVGSCGGDDDAARQATPEELSAVLLTAEDLGAGWTELQRDVFTTRAPENPTIDPSLWCPDAADQTNALQELAGQAGADVELQAEQADGDYRGLRQQAWSNADVTEYFAAVTSTVDDCSGAAWTDTEGNQYTAERLDGPSVGDESASWSVAVVISAPEGDMVSRAHQTIARFGATLMLLQLGDLRSVDAQPLFSETDAQAIIETAAGKVADLDTR